MRTNVSVEKNRTERTAAHKAQASCDKATRALCEPCGLCLGRGEGTLRPRTGEASRTSRGRAPIPGLRIRRWRAEEKLRRRQRPTPRGFPRSARPSGQATRAARPWRGARPARRRSRAKRWPLRFGARARWWRTRVRAQGPPNVPGARPWGAPRPTATDTCAAREAAIALFFLPGRPLTAGALLQKCLRSAAPTRR